MLSRRSLLKAAATSLATCSPILGNASPDNYSIEIEGALPPLPEDLTDLADNPPAAYIETAPVGAGKPLAQEITDSFDVLIASPYQCHPIEVAEYFLKLGAGDFGQDLRKYAREWPERANPVIFHFFAATRTNPAGDTTAWCAAFINWCHLRARAEHVEEIGTTPGFFSKSGRSFTVEKMMRFSTNSASSGSFRCNPRTTSPGRGDLVVMANEGTESTSSICLGRGHVAFYIDSIDEKVRMLGGNQSKKGTTGAVTIGREYAGPGSRFYSFVRPKE